MKREPRNLTIKTKSIAYGPNVTAELTIYKPGGDMYSVDVNELQLFAIQQVLGLHENENGDISMFSNESIKNRLEKMGILDVIVEE